MRARVELSLVMNVPWTILLTFGGTHLSACVRASAKSPWQDARQRWNGSRQRWPTGWKSPRSTAPTTLPAVMLARLAGTRGDRASAADDRDRLTEDRQPDRHLD